MQKSNVSRRKTRKRMKPQKLKKHLEYQQDHWIAKIIMITIHVALAVPIFYTVPDEYRWIVVLMLAKEVLWYLGTNSVHYIVESVRGHTHKVPKL